MFSDLLTKTFYGNTITDWAVALSIVVASLIAGKLIYWLIGGTVKKLTEKTETKLDDILVDMLEEPFVFFVTVFGIWYGLKTLTLSATAAGWIDKSYYILIIVNIAWLITRVFDALLQEYIVPLVSKTDTDIDDQLLRLFRTCIKTAVWGIAIIMALDNAGYSIKSILAGLGIGGLAFALAAQETVSNFFGGISIFIDKPFRVGDRIQVRGYDGVVKEIGMRSTRIKTRHEGRIVIIPNGLIARSDITNVDTEEARKIYAVYRLSPDSDPASIELAMKVLREIAVENNDVEDEIVTAFLRITEYSYDIKFLYSINSNASNLETRSAMNLEIVKRLKDNSIELIKAKPVHMKSHSISPE